MDEHHLGHIGNLRKEKTLVGTWHNEQSHLAWFFFSICISVFCVVLSNSLLGLSNWPGKLNFASYKQRGIKTANGKSWGKT
jgi:hypothetical protein